MLNHKKELNLDINKTSEYKYKLSPLIASILKGRNRKCDNTNDNLSTVIDKLIDQKDIDLKYSTYNIDALKASFAMFDFQSIKRIIDKDINLFTIYHYYYYKFTFNLIIKLLKTRSYPIIDNFINKHNNNISELVNPHLKLTKYIIFENISQIINYISTKQLKHFDQLYDLELLKWKYICDQKLVYIGKTYPPFLLITKDLLYLSIEHDPKYTILLLQNKDKFTNSLINKNLYLNINNDPIQLLKSKYILTKDPIYKTISDDLNLN